MGYRDEGAEGRNAGNGAAPFYEMALSRQIVRWIAVISFVLTIGILLYWVFDPDRLSNSIARFVASVLVATLMAIFFFVFYPDSLEMKLPGILGTTVQVTGPIVLFSVVFWLIHSYMPWPRSGRLFEIWKDGQRGGMYLGDKSTTYLKGRDGDNAPDHMLVGFPDGQRFVYGIYVIFPDSISSIKVALHHDHWAGELHLVLSREGSGIIDVSKVKEVSPNQ